MNKLGMILLALAVSSVAVVACGGDDSDNKTPDASPGSGSGSNQATVDNVSCSTATPTATVTASGEGTAGIYTSTPAGSASNDSAIKVGDVVEFNLVPTTTHPVQPFAAGGTTDSGIVAPDNAITCLKFTAVGTFHYDCSIHGAAVNGTVTVSAD